MADYGRAGSRENQSKCVLAQLIKYFVPMNFHCYSYASLVEVFLINRHVFGESKT